MAKYCDVQKFKSTYEHRVGIQFDNAIHEMEKEKFCVDTIPILDEIRAEIERQQKWLRHARYTAYTVDIAFDAIKRAIAESEE